MTPVSFPEANVILAKDQPQYEPLPIHRFSTPDGRIACCFRLSDEEIAELIRTKVLWMQQLTFGRAFQPIWLSTQRPHDFPKLNGPKS